MDRSDQEPREAVPAPARIPGYLSVKEAANLIGVSARCVYNYIESGRLPAVRVGSMTAVEEEAVRNYRRRPVGRLRTRTPVWHVPPANNLQYLTTISVRIRQGQSGQLDRKLAEIRLAGKHLLPGTAARYIARSQNSPDDVQIVLIWRSAVMPPAEEREAALATLRADLADILDWETAIHKEGQVMMHA
jgi:excisionase family DNA binding protein